MIVSGRVKWILQILDVEMKELLEVSKNCTSSCWLAVLCPGSGHFRKERSKKQRSRDPGILNIQKMCLFQLDLTPNHVDIKNRLAVAEKFWERRLGKESIHFDEGDAHILTDFDPPPLISMCFPGFLVPTYVLNTGGNFPENFVAISHLIHKDHGSHPMDVENTTWSNGVALVGLCLVRRSGCEGRLRRNNLVQRGLSRSAKPQGGIGQGCTTIQYPTWDPTSMGNPYKKALFI